MIERDAPPDRPAGGDWKAEDAALPLFSVLWAMHILWDYLSYASWFISPLALASTCAALYLLLRPSSPARLALTGYLYILAWFTHMPNVPNHETIGACIAIAFVSTITLEGLASKGTSFSAGRGLAHAVPIVRSLVILMYFYATFHKLNMDFLFASRTTCGAVFYQAFQSRFPFLPQAASWMNLAMAWATVIIEAALPLLLLVPRTRYWGIGLAWGFHLMLTLNPKSGFYNFTSLLFLLFLLYAPRTLALRIGEVWRQGWLRAFALRMLHPEWWRMVPKVLVGAAALGLGLWLVNRHSIAGLTDELVASAATDRNSLRATGFHVWIIWCIPLSVIVFTALRRTVLDEQRMIGDFRRVPRALWLITVIFFLWGAAPYLGLKTENSVAMFSNLRTEENFNHPLVPEALKLFSYQDDRVEILSVVGSGPGGTALRSRLGRRRGYAIPYEGFRGWLRTEIERGAELRRVKYLRNGELFEERYTDASEVFNQGMWAHKFLQFRAYRIEGPMTCEH